MTEPRRAIRPDLEQTMSLNYEYNSEMLSSLWGTTKHTANTRARSLRQKGKIEKRGEGRGTRWVRTF